MESTEDNRSVCVSNISPSANEKTVTDFFSFCGRITQLLLKKEDGKDTSAAVIQFETESAAKTALLLTNALIVDRPITVTPFVPASAVVTPQTTVPVDQTKITQRDFGNVPDENRSKTSVVASLLAAGYTLANDALDKAKEYDEKHNISLRAKVAVDQLLVKAHEIDVQYGISEKATAAKNTVVEKAKQLDTEYKITEKTSQAATTVKTSAQTAAAKIAANPTVQKGIDAVKQTTQKVTTTMNQTFNDVRDQTRDAIDEKKRERALSGGASTVPAAAPAAADTPAAASASTAPAPAPQQQ